MLRDKKSCNLRVIDGIVYQSRETVDGYNRTQFVLPKQIVNKVLDLVHTTLKLKTLKLKTERFFRPFLPSKVIEYVKTCDLCQKMKVTSSDMSAEMQIILPTRTNQLVSTYFTGTFKVTERGNKYIIVICDCYMIAIPLPNKETQTAAPAILENWCWLFMGCFYIGANKKNGFVF